jgi:phosphoribosylformylglycinamidine synthase
MLHRIEVKKKGTDPTSTLLLKDIRDLGITGVKRVEIVYIYFLEGDFAQDALTEIARTLLADPVSEEFKIGTMKLGRGCEIEIHYNPGVMDPASENIQKALLDLGYPVSQVLTGRRYHFTGTVTQRTVKTVAEKLLYNPLIQHIYEPGTKILLAALPYTFKLTSIEILTKTPKELLKLSKKWQLHLNLAELKELKDYYARQGRNPTDVELETFAQTWSEHCKHKTFQGSIEYNGTVINNLLKSTVMKITRELNCPWCLSVFEDNSGVIEFDDHWGISFKVETHNHPSALEPYGGAATGIGGVIRDCLGTGLGAKPIMNTDIFCFAPPDFPAKKVPKGVLHPKRVMKGVVAGVRDYGNRMGIPTANGAIYFDNGFLSNPLVYCGTIGIMPKNKIAKQIVPGDVIVVVGGRTGRDGIHGVTFASAELTEKSEKISSSSVQIGNPIEEKKLTDAILEARDSGLFNAITDCGGGGLSSAIGELASKGGVVELSKVPLKYPGLSYSEIWISESQERMVLFVAPDKLDRFLEICRGHDVEATPIGNLTDDGILRLLYNGSEVARLDLEFLHSGWPRTKKPAAWKPRKNPEPKLKPPRDLTRILLKLLSSMNIASKEWVIRQYDHEVQGASVLKPLVGKLNRGPSDGAVIRPLLDSQKGIAVANGINPRYGLIDPYWMAASAIDEALRNLTAVGGDIGKTALLDNFCWGNPDKPDQLGGLVRAAQACYDFGKGFGVPFISGKDSLYNEYHNTPIPPTLLISALSILDDVGRTVTMDFKGESNLIFLVGTTYNELGGSEYYRLFDALGNDVPRVHLPAAKTILSKLGTAIKAGLVESCHDLSEGGLGVAIAEMCLAGQTGAEISLARVSADPEKKINRSDLLLFSESNSRFLVEVTPPHSRAFSKILSGQECIEPIGMTTKTKKLIVWGLDEKPVVNADLPALTEAWQDGLTRWL